MKKIIFILTIFLIAQAISFGYEKDGTYECKYSKGDYLKATCTFETDNNGDITGTYCLSNLSLKTMLDENKCTFTKNTHYICKYSKGSCDVVISKNGHITTCNGKTPGVKSALEDAKKGKCEKK